MGFPAFLVLCDKPTKALYLFLKALRREAAGEDVTDIAGQLHELLRLEGGMNGQG